MKITSEEADIIAKALFITVYELIYGEKENKYSYERDEN